MSSEPPAPLTVHWSGLTDRGRIRPNNEDAFLALNFDGHQVRYLGKFGDAPLGQADFVFAVSDGMGGAQSGEFASKIAVEKITRLMPRAFRLSARGMATGFTDILDEIVSAIHKDLIDLGRSYEECRGMGATLSLGWFAPDWLYFAHLGDSRIYHLPKNGPLRQITHDHSYVGWLRRQGQLTEMQARMHPRRNVLQQALGAGNQFIDPHIGAVGYQTGDRFLFCSDGLIDGLWDRELEEQLRASRPLPEITQGLVQSSLESSGRDNTTAVVVELTGG